MLSPDLSFRQTVMSCSDLSCPSDSQWCHALTWPVLQTVRSCSDLSFRQWCHALTCPSDSDVMLWHVLQTVMSCSDLSCPSDSGVMLWPVLQTVMSCSDMSFRQWGHALTCPILQTVVSCSHLSFRQWCHALTCPSDSDVMLWPVLQTVVSCSDLSCPSDSGAMLSPVLSFSQWCHALTSPVLQISDLASALRVAGLSSNPVFPVGLFPGAVIPVTSKLLIWKLICQATGPIGSALSLVGLVSYTVTGWDSKFDLHFLFIVAAGTRAWTDPSWRYMSMLQGIKQLTNILDPLPHPAGDTALSVTLPFTSKHQSLSSF